MLVRQYRQDGLIELVHAESNPAKHRMYRLTDKGRNTKEAPIVRYETADAVISEVRANGQE